MKRITTKRGFNKWADFVPANDPSQTQRLFDDYFTNKNPSRLYRGMIDFNAGSRGISVYSWLFIVSAISFVIFVFCSIMLVREWSNRRKAKKEQERKLTESYTI